MTALLLLPIFACAKQNIKNLEIPNPQAIFDDYDNAINSKDGQSEPIANIHTVANMAMPMLGDGIEVETWIIKDVGMINTMDLPNIGVLTQAYNMDQAWILDPMQGDRLLTGSDKSTFLREYHSALAENFSDMYTETVVVGIKDIDGSNAWQVDAINRYDQSKTSLFFDIDSKLLIAQHGEIPQGKGSLKAKMAFKDYMDFNGQLAPQTVEIKTLGMTQTMTIKTLESNVDNPPTIEMPESIKAFITEDKAQNTDDLAPQEVPVEEVPAEEVPAEEVPAEEVTP